MQVLTEFVRTDLTEDQLLPVMRELLPVLISILSANEVSPIFILPCVIRYESPTHTCASSNILP